MKATFFSLAALAASAFAAPALDTVTRSANLDTVPVVGEVARDQVGDAVKIVDGVVVDDLGVGEIVDGATKAPASRGNAMSNEDLVAILETLLKDTKTQTASLNATSSKVESGKMTKAEGTESAMAAIGNMHFKLTDVVTKLTAAAGIPVAGADVDKVLNLVVALLAEVLFTVKTLVTILGLRPQLVSLLHSVFGLLANIITLVLGLVTGLLPGLVAGLSPLLAALGNGLLAPLLTPIVALVAGLAGQ